jgi:hypothetical protein
MNMLTLCDNELIGGHVSASRLGKSAALMSSRSCAAYARASEHEVRLVRTIESRKLSIPCFDRGEIVESSQLLIFSASVWGNGWEEKRKSERNRGRHINTQFYHLRKA